MSNREPLARLTMKELLAYQKALEDILCARLSAITSARSRRSLSRCSSRVPVGRSLSHETNSVPLRSRAACSRQLDFPWIVES
jgi:hypothetical protein